MLTVRLSSVWLVGPVCLCSFELGAPDAMSVECAGPVLGTVSVNPEGPLQGTPGVSVGDQFLVTPAWVSGSPFICWEADASVAYNVKC